MTHKLTAAERARLERNARNWTLIAYDSVTVTEGPHGVEVSIHSGPYGGPCWYEGDRFTSDGRVRETDNGHNEPYLLFIGARGTERRLMLDY